VFEPNPVPDVRPATRPAALEPNSAVLRPAPRVVVVTECHACGHEADDAGPPPARCPKCGGSAWARFARPADAPPPADDPADQVGLAARRGPRGSYQRRWSFDRPAHHVSRPSHRRASLN
jgi:hypothetical protein